MTKPWISTRVVGHRLMRWSFSRSLSSRLFSSSRFWKESTLSGVRSVVDSNFSRWFNVSRTTVAAWLLWNLCTYNYRYRYMPTWENNLKTLLLVHFPSLLSICTTFTRSSKNINKTYPWTAFFLVGRRFFFSLKKWTTSELQTGAEQSLTTSITYLPAVLNSCTQRQNYSVNL